MTDVNGILLVDKPKGWTSFDVVAKVRGIIRTSLKAEVERQKQVNTNSELTPSASQLSTKVKVGHTGTLDPSATGLLVLCIGKYTKKVEQMIRHDKTYEVEMKLGSKSTTGDGEGEITETTSLSRAFPERAIVELLKGFKGEQMQTPPMFSAIKVDGKRAYDLARAGKKFELEPRKIIVNSITLDSYEHPYVRFTCNVSSGTYIRSLVEDIASSIDLDAYMSELRRTRVAEYDIADALKVQDLNIESITRRLKA